MKYNKPEILNLSSQASLWCSTGTNGEAVDNTCGGGTNPLTTNCSNGAKNTSGHCKTGGSVKNLAPGLGLTYCLTGNKGKSANVNCTSGTGAYGATSCSSGIGACHCNNGNGA